MTKDEFNAAVQAIGTCEDDVQRREMLTALAENANADYDNIETLTGANTTLTNDNEALRAANMKLFLRVGEKSPEKDPDKKDPDEPGEKLKYDDLFDEKGDIK